MPDQKRKGHHHRLCKADFWSNLHTVNDVVTPLGFALETALFKPFAHFVAAASPLAGLAVVFVFVEPLAEYAV